MDRFQDGDGRLTTDGGVVAGEGRVPRLQHLRTNRSQTAGFIDAPCPLSASHGASIRLQ
jgi:hypothetical protein